MVCSVIQNTELNEALSSFVGSRFAIEPSFRCILTQLTSI